MINSLKLPRVLSKSIMTFPNYYCYTATTSQMLGGGVGLMIRAWPTTAVHNLHQKRARENTKSCWNHDEEAPI
jgi:hypothetical protein